MREGGKEEGKYGEGQREEKYEHPGRNRAKV